MRPIWLLFAIPFGLGGALAASCSAPPELGQTSSGDSGGNPPPDSGAGCGQCFGTSYTPCNTDGTPGPAVTCLAACTPGVGCSECTPGGKVCVGDEVHEC